MFAKSVRNGLDVMQGRHLGGRGLKGLWTPKDLRF